ncbi:YeiH family protein [Geodermatophilus sp. SYSU D00815]
MARTAVPSPSRPAPLAPGLAVAAAGTAAALALNGVVPAVSALTAAVVLGVLAGPLLPAAARAGLGWGTRRFLRLGVVLLGLQLGVDAVAGLGAGTVVAVVVTVVAAFAGTLLLGRLVGVPPGLTLLVATGFSICGAAAIAAMGSVARSRDEDVATGVTLVTLYGTAAIALVPLAGAGLGLDEEELGAWAGLAVHEVAQVVAAASPAGAAAVGIAVVVKLTRVLLLAPMVAAVGVVRRQDEAGRRPPLVPLFVLGFLAMVALRGTGLVPEPALAAARGTTTVLLAAALFGLGTAVRLGALLRTGRRGLLLGGLSTLLVGLTALGALALT